MKASLLVLVFMVTAQASFAADWRVVTRDESALWFLDATSMVSGSSSRTGWLKIVVNKQAISERGMRFAIAKYAAHCKKRQLQVLNWNEYREDGTLKYSAARSSPSREVVPETTGEYLYNSMCGSVANLKQEIQFNDPIRATDLFFEKQQDQPSGP